MADHGSARLSAAKGTREQNVTDLVALIRHKLKLQDEVCTPLFIATMLEAMELFDSKQLDYGPGNIATFGEMGTIIRLNDKLARMIHLSFTDGKWDPRSAANESIEDTWIDVANYGAIGLMCNRGLWPGVVGRRVVGKSEEAPVEEAAEEDGEEEETSQE